MQRLFKQAVDLASPAEVGHAHALLHNLNPRGCRLLSMLQDALAERVAKEDAEAAEAKRAAAEAARKRQRTSRKKGGA